MNKYILIGLIVYLIITSGCFAPSGYEWVSTKSSSSSNWMESKPRHISRSSWSYGQDVTPVEHDSFSEFLLHSLGTRKIK